MRRPTTRLQVSGHRFLLHRMAHALVRGDTSMLDDPLRAQSLSMIVGAVIAIIAVAGSAVLAVLRPQGAINSAPIMMSRETGTLYVRVEDTVHPVWNLASARLIAGAPADPQQVTDTALAQVPRGPLIGIPGAPTVIGATLPADRSGWTVCDAAERTTAAAGVADAPGTVLGTDRGVLVAPRGESAAITYLLYAGRRAAVDLRDTAVVRALGLDGVQPQPVSRALLDIVPEVAAIARPVVIGAGGPGPPVLGGLPVGTVVQLHRSGGVEFYLVLADGIQPVGALTADLIRFTISQPQQDIPAVSADVVAATAVVNGVPVHSYPDRLTVTAHPVVCARWRPGSDGGPATVDLIGADTGTAPDRGAVTLAQADGAGPHVDAVLMPAGHSAYVRSTDATGIGAQAAPRYLIDERGVVFGVRDDQTAGQLGLTLPAAAAPWPLLAWLPRGPELSRPAASVLRDSIGASPAAR